jgi:beta-lactamase class A
MGKRLVYISWVIVSLLAGLILGWFLHTQPSAPEFQSIRETSSTYKFISPLLLTRAPEEQSFPLYAPLKQDLTDYITSEIREGRATDVSVYYRDLNSGQWIYVNPDETFSPASMLKVVTLITVMRAVELDPGLLSRRVTLKGEDSKLVNSQTYYPTTNPIRTGHTYTTQELIDHLIVESDNVANAALIQQVGDDKIVKTYDDLLLHHPEDGERYTAQEYSRLFRILYNSTYLPRNVSEQVLELLSKTRFNNGLVAPLPKDTVVSHKFGVNVSNLGRELHDCGIVYYPSNPYFICVMTRGQEFPALESIIQKTSRLVWDEVSDLNN